MFKIMAHTLSAKVLFRESDICFKILSSFSNKCFPQQKFSLASILISMLTSVVQESSHFALFYLFIILVSLHKQKFTFPYFLPNIIPSRTYTESEKTFVWYFLKRCFVSTFYYFVKNEILHKYFLRDFAWFSETVYQ